MENCKKIIFVFVLALGIICIPKVSFAMPSFNTINYVDADGYTFNISDISSYIPNWNTLNDNQIMVLSNNQVLNFMISDLSNPQPYFVGTDLYGYGSGTQYNFYKDNDGFVVIGRYNSEGKNWYQRNGYFYIYDLNGPSQFYPHFLYHPISDLFQVSHYLHIIGTFDNASVNISNGGEIIENIVVTAQEDYYFSNVQTGFVLSNNDTIATFDISFLEGDFNLVATDFVTSLIGSLDPPVDPPVDPPTDDPIIIGDYVFLSSVPVANEFKNLFTGAIAVFEDVIPWAVVLVGFGISSTFIIGLLKKM